MKNVRVALSFTLPSIVTVDAEIFIDVLFSVVHSKSQSSVIPTGSLIAMVLSFGVIVVDPPPAIAMSAWIAEYKISSYVPPAFSTRILSVDAGVVPAATAIDSSSPLTRLTRTCLFVQNPVRSPATMSTFPSRAAWISSICSPTRICVTVSSASKLKAVLVCVVAE